ncbi:hypothetical protein PFISCL1PPCAC_9209, partial [Pristionchus fissidentatus]
SLMLLLFPSEAAVFVLVCIIYCVANRGRCGNRYRFHLEYERHTDSTRPMLAQDNTKDGCILRKLWRELS